MADGLTVLAGKLDRFLGDLVPLQHAAGQAGKRSAFDQIERAVGSDRTMSGLGRKVRLGAGYDLPGSGGGHVILNMRPKGLVILTDQGRKRSGPIRPVRGGGKRAVVTPRGPRARSSYGPSKGTRLVERTVKQAETDVVRAVSDEVGRLIERTF